MIDIVKLAQDPTKLLEALRVVEQWHYMEAESIGPSETIYRELHDLHVDFTNIVGAVIVVLEQVMELEAIWGEHRESHKRDAEECAADLDFDAADLCSGSAECLALCLEDLRCALVPAPRESQL